MRNAKATLLEKWFQEVWNQNREDSIEKLMAANCNAHGIFAPGELGGAAGFKIFHRNFNKEFGDIHFVVHDVIKEDDMESGLSDFSAIHRGTGKPVSFSGLCLVRIEEGKIIEAWNHYNLLSIDEQLEILLSKLQTGSLA